MCLQIQMSEIAPSTCLVLNQRSSERKEASGSELPLCPHPPMFCISGFQVFWLKHTSKRVLKFCVLFPTLKIFWDNYIFTCNNKEILYTLYPVSLSSNILQNYNIATKMLTLVQSRKTNFLSPQGSIMLSFYNHMHFSPSPMPYLALGNH